MPRIDPVTGCSVMTFGEFIQGEAEREGKIPAQIMEDIFGRMEEDDRRIVNEWKDPAKALEILVKECQMYRQEWTDTKKSYEDSGEEFTETAPEMPVQILEVLDAHHRQGLRSSDGGFTALCRCDDGVDRYFVYSTYYDSGSRLDPPEGGEEVCVHPVTTLSEAERELIAGPSHSFVRGPGWSEREWWSLPRELTQPLQDRGIVGNYRGWYQLTPLGMRTYSKLQTD